MPELNVLVSSAGRRVVLLDIFRETLRRLGLGGRVLAGDMSPTSAAFHHADAGILVPRCTASEFVPAVLDLCRRESVGLIIPTIDTELPVFARHRADFAAAGVVVAVSSPELIEIAGDKHRTHAWLTANGLPTVRQCALEEALRRPEDWPFPVLAKPAGGSSSVGVSIVARRQELVALSGRADYLVQSIAPGVEYTVDVLVDRQGRCRAAVPRRRLEVRGGEVSKGMTVRCEPIEKLARRVFELFPGAYGVQNVQIFHDQTTGQLNVIEINPRFGGGFPLTWQAGADLARWMVEEMLDLPSTIDDDWRDGLVMLRYDQAVFVDRGDAGV